MNYVTHILSIFLLSSSLWAQGPQTYTMELKDERVQAPRQIRLQLELSENDVKEYGLQQSTIFSEMQTRLSLAQIQIKDDPSLPKLVLRVKSIPADRAVATFVQLGYFEESTLLRNNVNILALTWSQATLISGPKEELIKEVTQVIISMINAFILDYNKAYQIGPYSTPHPQPAPQAAAPQAPK